MDWVVTTFFLVVVLVLVGLLRTTLDEDSCGANSVRLPQNGSKCFIFQGSSFPLSRSASLLTFWRNSGVNSPEASLSLHFWHARAKNSLLRAVLLSFALPSGQRSTSGRSWINLCWYSSGKVVKVCLLSIPRKFAWTKMEDGFCKSTHPSCALCIWAAADKFLAVLLEVLNPGIEARTSLIVVWVAKGPDGFLFLAAASCSSFSGTGGTFVSSLGGKGGRTFTMTLGMGGAPVTFPWVAMLVFLLLRFACCFSANCNAGRFDVRGSALRESDTLIWMLESSAMLAC